MTDIAAFDCAEIECKLESCHLGLLAILEAARNKDFDTIELIAKQSINLIKGDAEDETVTVPLKFLREAHAVMRECGWQLAPASEGASRDGVLELAAAQIVGELGDILEEVDKS